MSDKNIQDEINEIEANIKPIILQTLYDCYGMPGDNAVNLVLMKINQLLTKQDVEIIIKKFTLDLLYQVTTKIANEDI